MRVLVDTNIVIYSEDNRVVDRDVAAFLQGCAKNNIQVCIHKASYDDIARDANAERRAIIGSKLAKFPFIDTRPSDAEFARYGTIKSDNDLCDVCMLHAVVRGSASLLVTNDAGLLSRADRTGCGDWVFSPTEALEWLRDTFAAREITLPRILDRTADQLDLTADFFDSLRKGYPEFDAWLRKCAEQRRPCWTIEAGGQTEGLVILKDERRLDAVAEGLVGDKVLKVCTFKLSERVRGIRYGEHLLKRILWKYESEQYDLVYLTAYAEGQQHLLKMLHSFGFSEKKRQVGDEVVAYRQRQVASADSPARHTYPAFHEGLEKRKFIVPIRPGYHDILFPEVLVASAPSLFDAAGVHLAAHDAEHGRGAPGNSISKVYVCRTPNNQMRPGDILVFYMSKGSVNRVGQVATGLGVIEKVTSVTGLPALLQIIGKRCAIPNAEIERLMSDNRGAIPNAEIERLMSDNRGAKAIDFLFLGAFEEPVPLQALVANGIVVKAPQSICVVNSEAYALLRGSVRLQWEQAVVPTR